MSFDWYEEDSIGVELPNGSQYRITVGICSEFDIATYRTRLHAARTHLNETYALDPDAWRSNDIVEALGDHFQEWNTLTEWAQMMAATSKIAARTDESSEWEAYEMPERWTNPATAPRAIPSLMWRPWVSLINDMNPGLFNLSSSDASKKSVRLIDIS